MGTGKTAWLPDHQTGTQQTPLGLSKIVRAQAADDVASQLGDLVRSEQLRPGDRLPSELKLAELLGVSRPVVREALRSLRSVGLIVSKPGSGSYVAEPGTSGLPLLLGRYRATDLHEVRTLIEVPAAGFAAQRASRAQVDHLHALTREMDETSEHPVYAELDARFHIALAECTANAVHVRLVTDLHELIVENSDLALSANQTRQEQTTSEHRAIVDAVERRDADGAMSAMNKHLAVVSALLRTKFTDAEGASAETRS